MSLQSPRTAPRFTWRQAALLVRPALQARLLAATFASVAVFLVCGTARADEPLPAKIDRLIAARTPNYDTLAAGIAADAEFLRRITLDLAGTIPPVADVRAFLTDADPQKREKLIDRLLASPAYSRHMQHVFDVILMQRLRSKNVPAADWQKYLRESFAQNKPWDQLAREILSADGIDAALRPAARFFLDRDVEVNRITRDVGRIFLGVNLECAQCHDHPQIDDFKQQHYYGLAAFLVRSSLFKDPKGVTSLAEKADGEVSFESVFEIRDKKSSGPKTTRPRLFENTALDEPKFEKGQEYKVKPDKTVRPVPQYSRVAQFGPQVAAAENVRFRRAIANRLWALMMGRGLIEPVELDHSDNPPSHPELLDLLTQEVATRKFDIKSLLRELALTKTYQRSSFRAPDAPPADAATFAQASLRPLSPEQLAWAMLQATGVTDAERQALGDKATDDAVAAKFAGIENQFINLFGSEPGDSKPEFDITVDQALFLSNDPTVVGWLAPRPGNLTDRLSKQPADNPQAVADELYLSVLTRLPTTDESNETRDYLAPRTADRPAALQELVWALVTSAEFRFNH